MSREGQMEGLKDIWGPDGPMREMRPLLLWVATALVLRLPTAGRSLVREVQRRLRAADSTRVVRGVVADEVQAVMDGEELEAPAVEQRLGAGVGEGASFGWAHFPQDGGSLDVLLATARERARGEEAAGVGATDASAPLTPPMVKVD